MLFHHPKRRAGLSAAMALALAAMLAGSVLAASFTVTITSLPAAYRGTYTTATAKAPVGSRCTIRVVYKTGASTAKGLGPKTVPAGGKVTWKWLVGKNTTRGKWPVTVTCTKGGAKASAKKYLTVK